MEDPRVLQCLVGLPHNSGHLARIRPALGGRLGSSALCLRRLPHDLFPGQRLEQFPSRHPPQALDGRLL